jgi:hypothetical protein
LGQSDCACAAKGASAAAPITARRLNFKDMAFLPVICAKLNHNRATPGKVSQ